MIPAMIKSQLYTRCIDRTIDKKCFLVQTRSDIFTT
nr:MAG TPA: hypothetical protein [Caudoviricetes sp.]